MSRTFYIYFHRPVFDAVFLAGPYRLFWMLLLVHVGGDDFDALQAVLMRCRAMLTQRPCTQKTLMVYKAIFPLLWAWLYISSAGTPRGPRPPSPAGATRVTQMTQPCCPECENIAMHVTLTTIKIVCVTVTYVNFSH